MKHLLWRVVTVTMLGVGTAYAHGEAAHGGGTAFGHPGDPAKIARTIEVRMTDAMRFAPAATTVRKGETVRFVVHK